MQLKNLALLSMAALAVAAPMNDQAESPQDIHHIKDKIHSKKCPKPECPKSTTIITTKYHTITATMTKTSAKACAPTQEKNHCPKCGDPHCGGC
ncbi:hypothetical protein CJU90_6661 [Yarrowia sp. C11]|nr:hypothetical protein CJU90_6661 [Yarrowia sp. C11]KAG5358759.1 hypothetical protein CKK34_5039 [Yarrowia sp. E02]